MIQALARQVTEQMVQAIVGQEQTVLWCLAAVLSKGHILLEDIPGVGKTSLAVALAKVLGLEFGRVQFTSDVMPADVVGYCVPKDGALVYKPGPVQCNLFLADELNRATSRTQSALLEAMEEGQVTVDGVTHPIPKPFIVLATQNPTGAAGTQLLPDSQMDRFMVRLSLGYPGAAAEVAMVLNRQNGDPLDRLAPLLDPAGLMQLRQTVADTYIKAEVVQYIVELVTATRTCPQILQGASPRATLAITAMAKAVARMQGRDYVTPEDVQAVFVITVEHRLLPAPEWKGRSLRPVLERLMTGVRAPALI